MFLHVTQARYLHDYLVEVAFNDGCMGQADLREALNGPVFEPLRQLEAFSKLRLDENLQTIAWDNGADLAPEYLYFQAFKSDPRLHARFRQWGYLQ